MDTTRDPFRTGALLFWLWPLPHDPAAAAQQAVSLGATGVIPQEGGAAPAHVAQHAATYHAAGLDVVVGLGAVNVHTLNAGLETPGGDAVMFDAEGYFDQHPGLGQIDAEGVLAKHPDAPSRMVDCPWWKPKVHPHFPTAAFGRLVRRRFVQAYGADEGPEDGHSTRMLAEARAEYPAYGQWDIRPAFQMYGRSCQDHVDTLLTELATGAACLWDLGEMDKPANGYGHGECRTALLVVKALREKSFTGADALTRFQASAGLATDGHVGPRTCQALGVPVPDGIVWGHP